MSEQNYYDQQNFVTLEIATLAESINFNSIKDLKGKFYIEAIMPAEPTDTTLRNHGKYKKASYVELMIPAYLLFTFMQPNKIERITNHISHHPTHGTEILPNKGETTGWQYIIHSPESTFTIPSGTQFLIQVLEGYMEIENICIIGVRRKVED